MNLLDIIALREQKYYRKHQKGCERNNYCCIIRISLSKVSRELIMSVRSKRESMLHFDIAVTRTFVINNEFKHSVLIRSDKLQGICGFVIG